jgi:hypothetical protein
MNRHLSRLLTFLAIALTGPGLLAVSALAQQAEPATRTETVQGVPQASYLPRAKQVYDVVILGDVLGTGLWAGMNRVVESEDKVTVTGRIQESSGLGRPRLYNWPNAAAKLLDARQFDIAAIMLGANDARDITTEVGKLDFGSDEWRKVYAERLREFIKVLRDGKVAVYWFGVPPMASEAYDKSMQVVAGVERQVMAEAGVRYIDLQLLLRGSDGAYTDSGDDGTGEVVRLRSRDGAPSTTHRPPARTACPRGWPRPPAIGRGACRRRRRRRGCWSGRRLGPSVLPLTLPRGSSSRPLACFEFGEHAFVHRVHEAHGEQDQVGLELALGAFDLGHLPAAVARPCPSAPGRS